MADEEKHTSPEAEEEFGELITYTGAGFASGLIVGAILDALGFQRSPIGQWVVRTLSGELVGAGGECRVSG